MIRLKYLLNAFVVLFLWICIAVLLNLLFSERLILRKDFSRGNKYSLSPYSQKVLQKLKKPVTIVYYLSHKLPKGMEGIRRYSQDLFREYQRYSHGMLKFRFEDPVSPEDRNKDTLYGNGITDALVQTMASKGIPLSSKEEGGKFFYFFSSIRLIYLGRERVVEHIKSPAHLEYRLTSALDKLISLRPAKVGFYATENVNLSLKDEKSPFGGFLYHIWKLHPIEILSLHQRHVTDLSSEFAKELKKGKISKKLREELEKWEVFLSKEAAVRKNGSSWIVEDKGKIYLFEHQEKENRLRLYVMPEPIPEDVKILFVIAMEKVPKEALYRIDQFIQRGGKVVFLTQIFDDQKRVLDVQEDFYWSLPRHMRAQLLRSLIYRGKAKQYYVKVETNLEEFLRHYGIEMESVFLTDPGSCLKTIRESYKLGWIREVKKEEEIYFPEAIRIQPKNTNSNYSFVNNLEGTVFFAAHSYKELKKKGEKSFQFVPLFSTTEKVKVYPFVKREIREENFDLTAKGEKKTLEVIDTDVFKTIPRRPPFPALKNPRKHIGVLVTGHFSPYFSSPPWEEQKQGENKEKKGKTKATIIAIGNIYFLYNFLQEVLKKAYRIEPSAYRFAVEMVEWLDSGEDIAQVRMKHVERTPLRKLTEREKWHYTLYILAIPLVFVVFISSFFLVREG